MPHPEGGQGPRVRPRCTFARAFDRAAAGGADFTSTTGEPMTARLALARDRRTPVIVLGGERSVHGRVCPACWGRARSCTGERIGHAVPGLADACR